ncbi:MAG: DUF1667 domain-containing protein [Clostridia bacterium]|nr:DUF1667 domain-containing protein [Clostridia bacterium]
MTKRELTCIVCPRGCQLVAEIENGRLISVSGNICKRGQAYAEDECTHPKRVVTSTVRCKSGKVVAVKTLGSVPKEKMFEVMAEINSVVAPDTLSIGDVIIDNVCDTGVSVVATANS